MKYLQLPTLGILALFAITCSQQSPSSPTLSPVASTVADSSDAGQRAGTLDKTPLTATMQFGQVDVGSPFPPVPEHDGSAHAKDNVVPRTVVIRQNGTVTFNTFGVHRVTIYADGIEPEDLDTSNVGGVGGACPPVYFNDPTNRLAVFTPPCAGGPTAPSFLFPKPGRYLVVCSFLPHFEVQMWGWVIVKPE